MGKGQTCVNTIWKGGRVKRIVRKRGKLDVTYCLKITQKDSLEFSILAFYFPFRIDLSGNTA